MSARGEGEEREDRERRERGMSGRREGERAESERVEGERGERAMTWRETGGETEECDEWAGGSGLGAGGDFSSGG